MSHHGLPTPLWFALYGLLVGAVLGLPLAALCAPVPVSARLRALFALGPTSRWGGNYLLAVVGLPRQPYEWRGDSPVRAGGVLAVALGWYAAVTTVPVVLLTAIASI